MQKINTNLFNVLAECSSSNSACKGVVGSGGIPGDVVSIIHYVYLAVQVIVPIVLIIFGMIELGKAIASQKEDEISHAKSSFLKKLIIAVVIFLSLTIVQLVFDFSTSGNNQDNIWTCVNSIINGKC